MGTGYIWTKGMDSVKGVLKVEGRKAQVTKKHSAKGQWGPNGEGATVLSFAVDCTSVEMNDLITGYVEWWVINRFRRHSGILDTDPKVAIETWDSKTFDPTIDCLPPEGERKVDPRTKAINSLVKVGFTVEQATKILDNQDKVAKFLNK